MGATLGCAHTIKKELLRLLLRKGAAQEINCASPNLGITVRTCLDQISDPELKSEIEQLLLEFGMSE